MSRKIIDDFRIEYLNYLFDINLIFLRSKNYLNYFLPGREDRGGGGEGKRVKGR